MNGRKVAILQQRLTHYRCVFFEQARELCASRGIELHLVHGQPTDEDRLKHDEGSLTWADTVANRYFEFAGIFLVWQPFPDIGGTPELIIIPQENKLLSNYLWLIKRLFNEVKVAYGGHGRNFQSDAPNGLRERWKSWLLNKVDWWFAYTEKTGDFLLAEGYPPERITLLNNAIDNEGFRRDLDSVSAEQLARLRAEIDADADAPIGLFCGSLYPDKRLAYLVEAADRIQQTIPKVRLVVMGDGPSAGEIQLPAASRPWLHWVGARRGQDKAVYFKLASVVLNPGLVGLHVLDSFCAGVPMITTADAMHSPEIAYLRSGVNGLVVAGAPEAYAAAVIELLGDQDKLEKMKRAAMQDSKIYTLDNMVNRFVDGIEHCLASPKK